MNKQCSKCGNHPSLSYHPYCYTCLRISKGQNPIPRFHRDCSNKTMCCRCKKQPKAKGHNYCVECRNASVREWAKRNGGTWANMTPEQHKKALARKMIYNWVHRGKMTPQNCEVCGVKAMAHHDDYDKPLEVRWLCSTHHQEADKKKELVDAQRK